MAEVEHCEALIVGGGKAGKTLAADLARSGHDVVLVERGMIGGTCINVGCIPSKALIKSAKVAEQASHAAVYGIHVDRWAGAMPDVTAYKRTVVEGMIGLNWENLHGALGDRFLLGEARFVAPGTVDVRMNDGGATRRIRGQKTFINLGAVPAMPPLPGLRDAAPLTSESALELLRVPPQLVVLGGGYIGVELGQAFQRLGSRVTIVQRAAHLLPDEDPEISEAIEAIFRDDGIELLLQSEVTAVRGRSGERVELDIRTAEGTHPVDGTDLLVAVGRVPRTQDIGLSAAGVDVDARGFIVVNDRLETTAPDTWAMGDSAGSPQQTHVALDDYRIVKSNVFGGGTRRTTDRLIPHTVFIDPELGRVGLTEREARRRGLGVRVAQVPTAVVPRARTLSETRGLLRAVVDASSEQILGFAMLAPEAGEVAAVVQMAMLGRLPFTALRDGILAHPTMAEGLNYLFSAPLR